MAVFNGTWRDECQMCFETCCAGCAIAHQALDPDYEEEEDEDSHRRDEPGGLAL